MIHSGSAFSACSAVNLHLSWLNTEGFRIEVLLMAYTTAAKLIEAYTAPIVLELTDDDQDGEGDDDLVTAAIAYADAEIDSRLDQAYDVPFTGTIPTVIALIATWLAAGWMANRRRRANASILADAQRARAWLADLAEGIRSLPDVSPSGTLQPYSTTEDEQPVFARDRVDTDGGAIGPFDPTMTW